MNNAAADLRFVPLDAGDTATLDAWVRLTTDSAEDVPLSAAPPCAADLTGSVRFAPPDTTLASTRSPSSAARPSARCASCSRTGRPSPSSTSC